VAKKKDLELQVPVLLRSWGSAAESVKEVVRNMYWENGLDLEALIKKGKKEVGSSFSLLAAPAPEKKRPGNECSLTKTNLLQAHKTTRLGTLADLMVPMSEVDLHNEVIHFLEPHA
jgi:hypothetical protein